MKDVSQSRSETSATAPPQSTPRVAAAHDLVPRRIYVLMRLEEITRHIAELATEREKLTAELQGPESKKLPDPKRLRQRRAYLAQRLAALRNEQADLFREKKTIGAATRQADDGAKKRDADA